MTDLLKSEQYIKEHRSETVETMCCFAATDMLLFWSDKAEILCRQQKIWQPFLNALQKENNVMINVSESLQIPDNDAFIEVLKNKLSGLNDKELTAAFLTAVLLKSVILGLAILDKNLNVEQIFAAAFLEELYQNELWGIDNEAADKREAIKFELKRIKEYLDNG